jgi:hypothetical protein
MLGGAQDVFGIQEEVIGKLLLPNLLSHSNLDTETAQLFLDGMAETFKMMFEYYGWKFFLHFKPWLVENIKEIKDESLQAICAELASGFLGTIRQYGHIKEARKHY